MTHTTSQQAGTQTDTDGTVHTGPTAVTMIGTTEDTTILGTMEESTAHGTMAAYIIRGIIQAFTTLGTMKDGMTLGIMVAHTTAVGTTHGITDTCIHVIADGTEHGSHISITITMSDIRQEASIRAEKCTEDPV